MFEISSVMVAILNILCILYMLHRNREQQELVNALRQKKAALEELASVLKLKVKQGRITRKEE